MRKHLLFLSLCFCVFQLAAQNGEFKSVKEALKNPTAVKKLTLDSKNLTAFPPEITRFSNLEVLDLSNNPISSIPETFFDLKNIKKVILKGTKLAELSPSFAKFNKLEEIRVGYNIFTMPEKSPGNRKLPAFLFSIKSLKVIEASDWMLSSLPELNEKHSVKLINVSKNQISVLPPSLLNSDSLQIIDISNNLLAGMDDAAFNNSPAITSLVLNDNQLVKLPSSLFALKKIQVLNLNSNRLSNVNEVIGKVCALSSLKKLSIGVLGITSLSSSLKFPSGLIELDLSYNKLATLPTSVFELTSLTRLLIQKNSITTLPTDFSKLTSLEILDLSYNALTTVPDALYKLKSLTSVDISFNSKLTSVPKGISSLQSLRLLNIRNTKISSTIINQLNYDIPSCSIIM